MRYVSLHHHSTYSYQDGYGLPEEHVARVADLGMSAMALTEHGNVSSFVKLEQAAQRHGIQPIFGLEAYTAPLDMRETKNQRKWHLTLLAADQVGYHNLMQIVTRSWDEGFYRWPTVTWPILRDHHEGLIVLSGCADSKLACDLLGGKGREKGDERDAVRTLKRFRGLLGDRFYLETQQFPELARTKLINPKYEEWSRKYGIPLAATSDVHYPLPEHNEMQKILHAAGRNIGTVAAAEAQWEYDIRLTPPISDEMVTDRLVGTGLSLRSAQLAVQSTAEIAGRCAVTLPKMAKVRYPIQDEPDWRPGMTTADMFRKWMSDGWTYRGFHRLPRKEQRRLKERAEYEYRMMAEKDYLDYFMVLSDLVRYVKDHGVPVGPARGSAAASLVCYLLRITEVNPLEYPLMLFERFIAPDRKDDPDVDLDFDDDLREQVRVRAMEKYGIDRVGNIGTYTRYRGKNAIDDVARVYQIPKYEVDTVKAFIVERSGGDARFDASIEDTIEMFPKVKEVFDRNPLLYRSMELEGNLKSFGVHAAGVVIGSGPLWNNVATYSKKMGDGRKLQVLSVDKYDSEYLNILKLDALGLRTMGIIRIALELIGMSLEDLYRIPMTDPATLEAFKRADVVGIFQFDGRATKLLTQQMKPDTFMDLAALNALSRPGPLHSGSAGDYINVKLGNTPRESFHPIVDRITEPTEGQIIYQEQILSICREVGKFSWINASKIRKIISRKEGEAAFNALWGEFKEGAASQGIGENEAQEIWKRMVTAGVYAFNIAHSVSYAMLGFWTMWLKVHHPLAFYTAHLIKTPDDRKQLATMRDMQDARFDRSYRVLPPDLKESGVTWQPAPNGVRAGFSQIPGIGDKKAEAIVKFRDEVGFHDWSDLALVPGIGSKTISLIREFAEHEDPFEIHKIQNEMDAIVKAIKNGELGNLPVPNTMSDGIPFEAKRSSHVILGRLRGRNLRDLFEFHRSRYGEELDPKSVRDPELKESMTLYLEDELGDITVGVDRWKYPRYKLNLWKGTVDKDYILVRAIKRAHPGVKLTALDLWVIDPD